MYALYLDNIDDSCSSSSESLSKIVSKHENPRIIGSEKRNQIDKHSRKEPNTNQARIPSMADASTQVDVVSQKMNRPRTLQYKFSRKSMETSDGTENRGKKSCQCQCNQLHELRDCNVSVRQLTNSVVIEVKLKMYKSRECCQKGRRRQ